ncbi:hypothetical protein HUG17_2431 [Dermatophagoides farinae]|uniref:Uncharacterized protein n=1 Tax=Dermatophagoides farinae TaxID=6954 RepID=A0A9D4NU80_DERFA|nr:hypothetical protein HUG17_2431 [Dermatophagoides farinae]
MQTLKNFEILAFFLSLLFHVSFLQELETNVANNIGSENQTAVVDNNESKIRSVTNRMLVNVRCAFYQKAVIPMTRMFNLSITVPSDIPAQCPQIQNSLIINVNTTENETEIESLESINEKMENSAEMPIEEDQSDLEKFEDDNKNNDIVTGTSIN